MNHVIILAGGKGTRMKSDKPKVLTPVKDVPIIKRLLTNITPICPTPTLIIGHQGEEVVKATDNAYHYVEQKEQRGTGHAILCAKPSLSSRTDIESIVVLPGDHPLVSTDTINRLITVRKETGAVIALATLVIPSYEGENSVFHHFGRIVKDEHGTVSAIVEYKDASEEIRNIKELNLSYYCFDPKWLWENIDAIDDKNASGEFYLTDLVAIARSQGKTVVACPVASPSEAMGINTPEQLKIVESFVK